jgi:hypothetical protein
MVKKVTINWGEAEKAPEERKKWLGAWLISREGEEGDYFYDGPGGTTTTHESPAEAIGLRLRWWPSANTPANLVIGPIATLTEDCFFSEQSDQIVTVKAMSLVR